MPVIHLPLPSNGDDAIVDVYNAAITAILAVLNGGIDTNNIASVAGTSIVAGSIPMTAMGPTVNLGWIPLSQSFTYGTNNGQKEFTITTNVDLTAILSPGDRFQLTRGTVAPTHSMAFTATSSQYATKVSPAGLSFTGAFTCEAWVYLNSYGLSMVVNRLDAAGQNGWYLQTSATGQLTVGYGGGSGLTAFQTYQSIPLKRWVHVAGVVSSTSGKTGALYINGTAVGFSTTGTQTALVQPAANLSVGAWQATTSQYFDGYVHECRVWAVAQTQAAVQSNMGISLAGSESNLVALFQGDGNFNDKTTNANTLTATNGAIATQLINPYHNTELFLVTAVSYANPTCTITLFGGTDYMVPNMALLNPAYSIVKIPFGFPDATKWVADMYYYAGSANTPGAGTVFNVGNAQLSIPTGPWKLRAEGVVYIGVSGSQLGVFVLGLHSVGSVMPVDVRFQKASFGNATGSTALEQFWSFMLQTPLTLTSQTMYYLNGKTQNAATHFDLRSEAPVVIQAESAYV